MRKPWAMRAGSVARAEDLLTACVRACARYVAADAGDRRLVVAIGALLVEYTALEPSREACHAALLEVGRRALAAREVRLGRVVADSAVALDSGSAEAWVLRGRALDADGRGDEAAAAYRRGRATAA